MLARFFIDRPIFAAVVSIVITLAGGVAVIQLPIAQYPDITPPTVQVLCTYPGASAQVVADTIAAPIEQQVNGVEDMLYMSSQCTNDGAYNLTVTFRLGVDLSTAQVLVQNRVSLAMPQLPEVVQRSGVNVKKRSPNILLAINLISPDRRYDSLYLSNYATIFLKDELARLEGVGDISFLGQRDYSMRIWLDPERMQARDLSAGDIARVVRNQNVEVASGKLAGAPAVDGRTEELNFLTLGRLVEPDDFADMIVKTGAPGPNSSAAAVVRLKDVARIELGAQQYDQSSTLDGQPALTLAIFQLPGSNALATARGIYQKMEQLKNRFPDGLDYRIDYDTTPFITESIEEVVKTLRDAVVLVAIVVLIFLQSWRAAIIPLVAVPVAIVGTFSVMAALGFSLNNLSLFGLVLAIGIVVDDAIVVVENVEHHMAHGLPPREAAHRAMEEVTGPVIAVALVLAAVFVPCAFISGITGQFFRQFALTIAVSTAISAINSLTLSPALAAILLRPPNARKDLIGRGLDYALGWFFRLFNSSFALSSSAYVWVVGKLLRGSLLVLALYAGLLVLTGWTFSIAPTGFIPQQDKGYLLVNVQLPDAASAQRTREVVDRIGALAREIPGVAHTVGVAGMSVLLNANGSNFASMFVVLEEFKERHDPRKRDVAVAAQLRAACLEKIPEAQVSIFGAPPVDGLGTAGGFKFMIEDRGDLGLQTLAGQMDEMIAKGRKLPGVIALFSMFRANTPQLYIDVDRTKCRSMGVPVKDVFDTLQIYMGSLFVNNFNRFGRTWQVNLQADSDFRREADAVAALKVRNAYGEMVPLGTLCDIDDTGGPVMVTRYNMYPAAPVNGMTLPFVSSGQAIKMIEDLAKEQLPLGMTIEWTELTYMQILAGNTAMLVFTLAVILVFLVLAAQYESWSLPLAVILVVPMCLLSSIVGVLLSRLDVNIFTQIGFVVLVGLASKNAILIVEFAKARREAGDDARQATLEACRLRLRPIMMTSFAFILGVAPLVTASGAGAEMRRTLGVAVFSGMLGVTIFGIFLTPVFYFVIDWLSSREKAASAGAGKDKP